MDSEHGGGLSSQRRTATVCGLPQTRASRVWLAELLLSLCSTLLLFEMDRELLLTLNFHRAPPQNLWDVAVSPGVCPTLIHPMLSSQGIFNLSVPLQPVYLSSSSHLTTLFSLSVPPQHFTLSLFPHLNQLNLPLRPTKIHPFVLSLPVLTFYHLKTEPKFEFPYPGEIFLFALWF